MKRLLATALVAELLITMPAAFGQCTNGRCALPIRSGAPSSPAIAAAPLVEWVPVPDRPDEQALYVHGRQAGSLRADGVWLPIVAGQWGARQNLFPGAAKKVSARGPDCHCRPACDCAPCLCAAPGATPPVAQNFGMDWRPPAKESCRINGQECDPAEVLRLIGGAGQVPDDSQLPTVTVIDSDEARRKQIAQDLARWDKQVRVQAYPPDHWASQPFKATAFPTLSFQSPDGRELSRMTDYADGPARVERTLQKLRSPDPNFDPGKTPDLSKPKAPEPKPEPKPAPAPARPLNPNWFLAGGAALVGFLLRTKGVI